VGYSKNALTVNFAGNFTDAQAPNLLLTDPSTGKPAVPGFQDAVLRHRGGRHAHVRHAAGRHVRRQRAPEQLTLSIAPNAQNRTEFGGYAQDEILMDRLRFVLGRVSNKFGNLDDPVLSAAGGRSFSSRLRPLSSPLVQPGVQVAVVINNYLDTSLIVPTDLSALAGILPVPLRPPSRAPFRSSSRASAARCPSGARRRRR